MNKGSILSQSTKQVGLGLRDSQQGEAQPGHTAPVALYGVRGNPSPKCGRCGRFMSILDESGGYRIYMCRDCRDEVIRLPVRDAPDYPEGDLGARPSRSVTPEARMRMREGVRRRRWRPAWTPEEERVLAEVYGDPHAYLSEAAARLGRTVNAVACKACEMGLEKKLQEWPE